MAKLTDILNNTGSRVNALENDSLDRAAGVSKITKVYGNIRITTVMSVNVMQYATPDDDFYPSDDSWSNELNLL